MKGARDIISHHYFDLNAEAIYDVCEKDIPVLIHSIEKIIKDVNNPFSFVHLKDHLSDLLEQMLT